ncbi:MAG: hypothetical protein AABW67_04945 [Nanoarchaeota archaeon]
MGKDKIIKTIGKLIGGMTAHKILIKHNLAPESDNHLRAKAQTYGGQIEDNLEEYHWNNYDKAKIKKEAQKSLKKELKRNHFEDVCFPISEEKIFLDETFNEFFDTSH